MTTQPRVEWVRRTNVARLYVAAQLGLPDLVQEHLEAATMYPTTGIWEGKAELSTMIEVVGRYARSHLMRFARAYLERYPGEDAVLFVDDHWQALVHQAPTQQKEVEHVDSE